MPKIKRIYWNETLSLSKYQPEVRPFLHSPQLQASNVAMGFVVEEKREIK